MKENAENWYFLEDEKPKGPHPERVIQLLLKSGEINAETMVSSDGKKTWQAAQIRLFQQATTSHTLDSESWDVNFGRFILHKPRTLCIGRGQLSVKQGELHARGSKRLKWWARCLVGLAFTPVALLVGFLTTAPAAHVLVTEIRTGESFPSLMSMFLSLHGNDYQLASYAYQHTLASVSFSFGFFGSIFLVTTQFPVSKGKETINPVEQPTRDGCEVKIKIKPVDSSTSRYTRITFNSEMEARAFVSCFSHHS
ncbi:DUF4339 domain-containing protein [Verrucomicrobiaceae bacterium N1E253]|uniref:DUF4339 domain-containing protein n=1 Tax=Oceaniferula marina TaxID=2748318 RepID=A0A851GCS1_9BACT|nr:DUF4339 domain-containing protein [Oceaniferula marina]NWK54979.1 DUF4339 domain-containing protein [Oceaniferula marina]